MPMPSKFKDEVRKKILQALSVGASQRTAAAIAGVDAATLSRWLQRGRQAAEGTSFREFYEAVQNAEAQPRVRALGIIYKEMPDKPELAWKFIERREPGYAPPMPAVSSPQAGPITIQLAFSSRNPLELVGNSMELVGGDVIEGEVVDEQDGESGAAEAPA